MRSLLVLLFLLTVIIIPAQAVNVLYDVENSNILAPISENQFIDLDMSLKSFETHYIKLLNYSTAQRFYLSNEYVVPICKIGNEVYLIANNISTGVSDLIIVNSSTETFIRYDLNLEVGSGSCDGNIVFLFGNGSIYKLENNNLIEYLLVINGNITTDIVGVCKGGYCFVKANNAYTYEKYFLKVESSSMNVVYAKKGNLVPINVSKTEEIGYETYDSGGIERYTFIYSLNNGTLQKNIALNLEPKGITTNGKTIWVTGYDPNSNNYKLVKINANLFSLESIYIISADIVDSVTHIDSKIIVTGRSGENARVLVGSSENPCQFYQCEYIGPDIVYYGHQTPSFEDVSAVLPYFKEFSLGTGSPLSPTFVGYDNVTVLCLSDIDLEVNSAVLADRIEFSWSVGDAPAGSITYDVYLDGVKIMNQTTATNYTYYSPATGSHMLCVEAYWNGLLADQACTLAIYESPYYLYRVRTAIKVMQLNQPIAGAQVVVKDSNNNTVFEGVTGYDGRVGVELYYNQRYNVTVTHDSITTSRTFYPTQQEFIIYLPSSASVGTETLTVYVYDELSGQPIENARIIAGNSYAHTDSSGKATVSRTGAVNITVSCPEKGIPPRTFYVPSDQNTTTVYIAPNVIKNTVVIKDITGNYYQPLVIIKNGDRTVTKAFTDKQNQLETYLVEGIPYKFTLISNGKQRECGIYYASSTGTVTIVVGELKLKPSVALFRTTVSYDIGYDPDTQTVYGYYYDKANKTDWVNFTVWNWNKTKVLYSYNGTPNSPVEFTYPYSGNDSVIVEITAKRGDYTFHDLKVASVGVNLNIPMFRGDYKLEQHAAATALLIFFAGLFSYVHSRQGALMVCLFAWFLYMVGWLQITTAILTTATVIAIFGLFGNRNVR